jgi:hypothetical protein
MPDITRAELATRGLMNLARRVDRYTERGLAKEAMVLVRAIKVKLSQKGSGIIYGRRRHQASAPGEPPAVDTGALRASIGMERVMGANPGYRVGTGLPYAAALEFGHVYQTTRTAGAVTMYDVTHGRRVLLPRPFMRPALKDAEAALGRELTTELRAAGSTAFGGAA